MSIANQIKHIPGGVSALSSWLGEGGRPVDNEIAQQRTDICISSNQGKPCKANVREFSVTAPVAAAIRKVVEIRNAALLRTNGIKKLGTCRVCTCHLPTKIFVPIHIVKSQITEDEAAEFKAVNPNCWQITEQP